MFGGIKAVQAGLLLKLPQKHAALSFMPVGMVCSHTDSAPGLGVQAPVALQIPELMQLLLQGVFSFATTTGLQRGPSRNGTHRHPKHVSAVGGYFAGFVQSVCCTCSCVHPNAEALSACSAASTGARTRSAGSLKRPSFPDYGHHRTRCHPADPINCTIILAFYKGLFARQHPERSGCRVAPDVYIAIRLKLCPERGLAIDRYARPHR
jgi:hypothetical protein